MNWQELMRESRLRAGALMKVSPKLADGFNGIHAAKTTTGALDAKTREFIALAVAITTKCDSCIAAHADAARKLGVTEAELADAMAVAIALNTGAAFVYASRVMEAFQQSKQPQE